MCSKTPIALVISTILGFGQGRLAAQATHEIRLEGNAALDRFQFAPSKITARPGDVLKFIVRSGPPHTIVFEGTGLAPEDRAALNASMPDRLSDLSGPLLRNVGTEYRITVPSLPPGTYRFYCLTHRSYRMSGELTIREARNK